MIIYTDKTPCKYCARKKFCNNRENYEKFVDSLENNQGIIDFDNTDYCYIHMDVTCKEYMRLYTTGGSPNDR